MAATSGSKTRPDPANTALTDLPANLTKHSRDQKSAPRPDTLNCGPEAQATGSAGITPGWWQPTRHYPTIPTIDHAKPLWYGANRGSEERKLATAQRETFDAVQRKSLGYSGSYVVSRLQRTLAVDRSTI